MTQVSGQKLWLDEGIVHGTKFMKQLMNTEKKRPLSPAEENLKNLSAAYVYLYNKALVLGILEEDEENLFEDEILH
jgi:hypothetical protein|tara:strand:- start:162 stop:389 length:228 start_codon:yes stop_codon:yes gene_type:complete